MRHKITRDAAFAVMFTARPKAPRGHGNGRALRRKAPNRRLIAVANAEGREWSYHATKGWRSRTLGR